MSPGDIIQLVIFFIALLAAVPLLGTYMHRVFSGQRHILTGPLGWMERSIYRLLGIDPDEEMTWREYCKSLLVFNALGLALLFAILVLQRWLPLNPMKLPNVPFWLALNTAVSFVTNTNWQAYAGETTLSYFSQMLGLTVQNFLSAATGMAAMLALIRGFTRQQSDRIGNYWVDLVRGVVHILLPLSVVLAIVLAGQGVIQNLKPYVTVQTLEGGQQVLPMGPVASQVAIKQLGTNGGGFFGVNSTHPFENPTPLSNFLELVAILLIPAALTYTFGRLVGNRKQGFVLLTVMLALFIAGLGVSLWSEYSYNPVLGTAAPMEGKEVRIGQAGSVLWSVATTAASNGSVNAMHDSMSPLSGLVAMLNMMLGEVVFGGVGCGLYGMVLFALIAVFIAGLMVGRTPEYLGKKLEAREIVYALLGILGPSVVMLLFAALACMTPGALASLSNRGPHGLSQILYAFASAAANNGSALAGLNANTRFFNVLTGVAMLVGRFVVLIPVIAIGGSLAVKRNTPESAGTMRTDTILFTILLTTTIIVVGALTFFPALALGPLIEHLLMAAGRSF